MAKRLGAVREQSGKGVGAKLGALAGGIMERVKRIPLWVWLLIAGALVVLYLIYRNGGIGGGGTSIGTTGNQLPGLSSDNSLTGPGAIGTGTTAPSSTGSGSATGTSGSAPASGGDATSAGALSTFSTIPGGVGAFAPLSSGGGTASASLPDVNGQFLPFGTLDALGASNGGPATGTDARSDPSYSKGTGVQTWFSGRGVAGVFRPAALGALTGPGAGGTDNRPPVVLTLASPTVAPHPASIIAPQATAPHVASAYIPRTVAPAPAARAAPRPATPGGGGANLRNLR